MKIPTVRMGQVDIPRLILGHLPFMGESYQGEERNRIYVQRFSNITNTINVIVRAIECGITTMAITSSKSPLSQLLREAVLEAIKRTGTNLSLLPCFSIPLTIDGRRVDDYRRWLTYYEYEQRIVKSLIQKYVEDPILQCRPHWETKFPAALQHSSSYKDDEIARLQIDYSKMKPITAFKDFRVVFAEVGSESDFLTMTGRLDLLSEFIQFLRSELQCPVLLGVHHAGITIPLLEDEDIGVSGYVTPVNVLGALMLPSQSRALQALSLTCKPIIAIKPLAGGRLTPEDAFKYVFSRAGVGASMIGVASETEVEENISAAMKYLV